MPTIDSRMAHAERVHPDDDFDGAELFLDFDVDGLVVPILLRADFSLDGRIAGAQSGVVAYGVDMTEWASGLLMVLLHSRSAWIGTGGTTASWGVEVQNVSIDADAPELEFVERIVASVTAVTSATPVPRCQTVAFSPPFGPQARVRWTFDQGGLAATAALRLSASIYLIGRRGR